METKFQNPKVNELLDNPNKVYGGIAAVGVGSKFTLPESINDENLLVRESVTTYKNRAELEREVRSENARNAFHQIDGSQAWERRVNYLVIACPEGDLALGTLCSAAAAVTSNRTPADIKKVAATSVTANVRGRAKQVLAWVESNPGLELNVTTRTDYEISTNTAGNLKLTLTVFNGETEKKKGKKA